MDAALKERKLASASVRKQRMQERQKQKDFLYEQREERKRRQLRYSEVYNTDSGSNTSRSNSPENDSAANTPSEYSVRTPDNSFSPHVEIKARTVEMVKNCTAKKEEKEHMPTPTLLERRRSKPNTSKPAVLTASLNRPCDFRYERFSTVLEPIDIHNDTGDESSSSGGDQDEDEYSPIEIATPVAIRMPISRPSVISVVSGGVPRGGPPRFSVKNIETIMVSPPQPASSRLRQVESISEARPPLLRKGSGFLASEAKPLEVTTPSTASVVSLEPCSTRSLSPARQEDGDHNLRKKSSMPMLGKFSHSRMHSIKNFIKTQSISGPPPAMPQVPAAHQSRPSESVNTILSLAPSHNSQILSVSNAAKHLPPSPRRSLTEPTLSQVAVQEQRPQTARMPSQSSITALPCTSTAASRSPQLQTWADHSDEAGLSKKKSFSNLRRRSGSLGQALKFSSSKNKSPGPPAPEAPLPPVPMIRVPSKESIQSVNFPTPPSKKPRSIRKSGMMYSPFPPATQQRQPVGLGLRM